jgi:hypothetical protein
MGILIAKIVTCVIIAYEVRDGKCDRWLGLILAVGVALL